jgi:hypothetical protein
MKRPLGVSIIAILLFLGAILGIIAALNALGVFGDANDWGLAIPALILTVFQLVVAILLWRLNKWGWILAIGSVILNIANYIWAVFGDVTLGAVIIGLVLNVIIFLYLWSPGVRGAFFNK